MKEGMTMYSLLFSDFPRGVENHKEEIKSILKKIIRLQFYHGLFQ